MRQVEDVRHITDLWQRITEALDRSEPVVLATIVRRQGSGPREAGASMAVWKEGGTLGTIGGGPLEARVQEMAWKAHQDHRAALERFSLRADDAQAGGMLCGGDLEVLVDYLDPNDPACGEVFRRLLGAHGEGRLAWLVRSLRTGEKGPALRTGIGLLTEEGLDAGSLKLACCDKERLIRERRPDETVLLDCGDTLCLLQPIGRKKTVFIFGAGHVAQSLAPICALAGFRVVVIDDRTEFAVRERFPTAAEVRWTSSYPEEFGRLAIDRSGFVVIVTHAHDHDRTVLVRALKTDARYIGMIASRRKRELILASLAEEGMGQEELGRVHSPIGLDIGAQTPGEIAVSIAAELVAVRAGKAR